MGRKSRIFLATWINPNLLWKCRQKRSGSHHWYKRPWRNLLARTKVLPVEIHQKISLLKLKLHRRKITAVKSWSQIVLRLNRRLLIQNRKNRVKLLRRKSSRVLHRCLKLHKMSRFSKTSSILWDILVETSQLWPVKKLKPKLILKRHLYGLVIWIVSTKPSPTFKASNRVINRDQKRNSSGLTSLFSRGPKLSPNSRRTKKMRKLLKSPNLVQIRSLIVISDSSIWSTWSTKSDTSRLFTSILHGESRVLRGITPVSCFRTINSTWNIALWATRRLWIFQFRISRRKASVSYGSSIPRCT